MHNSLGVLLCALLCVFMLGCSSFRPSWISENHWEVPEGADEAPPEITQDDFDGPLGGSFNEEGEWVPDDPTIEATYHIPDIKAGFIVDFGTLTNSTHSDDTLSITPSLQIEVVEFDLPGGIFSSGLLAYMRTWSFDVGVGYGRLYGYLGPRLTSIFEITVGFWGGWNFDGREPAFGVGVGVIKF